MGSDLLAQARGIDATRSGTARPEDLIELSLLLPAHRVEALVHLSRARQQSVAQVLRGLIDQALNRPA